MNAQEVTRLRKLGQVKDALDLSNQLLVKDANNLYNRRAAGWVYLELIKTQCHGIAELNEVFKLIIDLKLDTQEEIFWEQIRWQVAKLLYRIEHATPKQEWALFCNLWVKFPVQISLGNSTFLKAFIKYQAEIPPQAFCKCLANLNIFQACDYQPEIMNTGKRLLSVVERVCIAIAKSWANILEINRQENIDLKVFLEKLDSISEQHPNMMYLIYYRAVLKLSLGKMDDAKKIIIPFAQKKQSEFWVWDLLAQLHTDNTNMQVACLAKALLCKASPDFLVKVRQKMVSLLISLQEWDLASTELHHIIKVREANNWQISAQLNSWLCMPEIANANKYTQTNEAYQKYSIVAERLLDNTSKYMGVIWKVNKEKKTAQFFVDANTNGGFNYERLKIEVGVGTLIELTLVKIVQSEKPFWQVKTAKKCENQASERLYRNFSGVLKKVGNVGFVEDVFVEDCLAFPNKATIEGKAIRAYDAKKDSWGWKAISIDSTIDNL
jgi:hypothetical protein